jgi:hypothetical protein
VRIEDTEPVWRDYPVAIVLIAAIRQAWIDLVMKRNDIDDSYVLGYLSGSLRRGECIHPRGRSRRPMLASTPYNRHGSARFDAQKSYADTPTIRNARSLLFPFHSPAPWSGFAPCIKGAQARHFHALRR